jgi:mercuric ion binding protein
MTRIRALALRGRNAMRLKFLAVALVALLFVSATSALASVGEIQLYVKGLACPFCTFGIEKSLKKVPGVVSVETTIRTGVVRIQLELGAQLDPAALNEAVKKSGFTPSRIEATITGTLVTSNEHPALKSSETGQTFRLGEPGEEGSYELLSAELLEKLKKASANSSKRLTVSGRVHIHTGLPPVVAVESFEVAP